MFRYWISGYLILLHIMFSVAVDPNFTNPRAIVLSTIGVAVLLFAICRILTHVIKFPHFIYGSTRVATPSLAKYLVNRYQPLPILRIINWVLTITVVLGIANLTVGPYLSWFFIPNGFVFALYFPLMSNIKKYNAAVIAAHKSEGYVQ